MLFSALQDPGQLGKNYPAHMSVVPRLRNLHLDILWNIQAIGLEVKAHLPKPVVSPSGGKMDMRPVKSPGPLSDG